MKGSMGILVRGLLCLFLVLALSPAGPAAATDWSVGDALKQIDKATAGIRGLTGGVTLTDQRQGAEPEALNGKVLIRMDGRIRIEADADQGKTVLCVPGKMFVYDPARSAVTEYPLSRYPEKLAQYALLGFSERGGDLKKDFLVTLVEENELDGHRVAVLDLTPKKDRLRESISRVRLWVDQATWLPIQQRIFHGGADTHLTVRYENLARNDKLSNDPFKPKWPKGTRKEKP